MKPIRFALVGGGWRGQFYLRIAKALPDIFQVAGICVAHPEHAEQLEAEWNVPCYAGIEEMVKAQSPLYMVLALPQSILPEYMKMAVALKSPVLCETSFAESLQSLINEYEDVGRSGRVQVAEQYPLHSIHVARLNVIASGVLGDVHQVQLSVAHGYHAASLLRHYLGTLYDPCEVTGRMMEMPVIEGPGRSGYPDEERRIVVPQELGMFRFERKWGAVDFADDQYFSPVFGMRVLIRGDRGEIMNNTVRYFKKHNEPVEFELHRIAGGLYGSMEAPSIKGIQGGVDWYYKNPFPGARLSDEEIALAEALVKMARFAEDGTPFYPFASACQDRYLTLALKQSAKENRTVRVERQVWCP